MPPTSQQDSAPERMAYIFREKVCRHATIVTVDSPEHAKDVAREVAKAIRQGMTVERVTIAEAREAIGEAMKFKHTAKGVCSVPKAVPA